MPLYDGDALAKKGVVVVTMNYRLGRIRLLRASGVDRRVAAQGVRQLRSHGHARVARWVKSNIAAFGGDPNNVTVFGQSAGAMAIASLVASPESKGLFQRAISAERRVDGPRHGARHDARARKPRRAGVKAATDAGVTPTAEQLRAMSAADVTAKLRSGGCPGMIVDGWVIPEDPSATFAAGKQNAVDVLVGSNKDELSFGPRRNDARAVRGRARIALGRSRRRVPEALSARDRRRGRALEQPRAPATARSGTCGCYADYQVKKGNKAYLYFFAQNPPATDGKPAFPAAHASEVPYVFNNLGQLPLVPGQQRCGSYRLRPRPTRRSRTRCRRTG